MTCYISDSIINHTLKLLTFGQRCAGCVVVVAGLWACLLWGVLAAMETRGDSVIPLCDALAT